MTEKSNESKHGNRGLFDNDVRTGSGSVAADEKLVGDKGYTEILKEANKHFAIPDDKDIEIKKLKKELDEWKLSHGRLEDRVIETNEFGLAEINKLKADNDELHNMETLSSCEIIKLKEKNRQLTDYKIDSELRLDKLIDDVEGLEKQIVKLEDRNEQLKQDNINIKAGSTHEGFINHTLNKGKYIKKLEDKIADLKKEKPKTDEAFNSLVSRWIKDHKYQRNKIEKLEGELILALRRFVKMSEKCTKIHKILKEKI